MNPQDSASRWQNCRWAGGSERIGDDGTIGLISGTRAPRSIQYITTPMSTYNQIRMDILFEPEYTGKDKHKTLTIFLSDANTPYMPTWINTNWRNIDIDNLIDTQIAPAEDKKKELRTDVDEAMEHHWNKSKHFRETGR